MSKEKAINIDIESPDDEIVDMEDITEETLEEDKKNLQRNLKKTDPKR